MGATMHILKIVFIVQIGFLGNSQAEEDSLMSLIPTPSLGTLISLAPDLQNLYLAINSAFSLLGRLWRDIVSGFDKQGEDKSFFHKLQYSIEGIVKSLNTFAKETMPLLKNSGVKWLNFALDGTRALTEKMFIKAAPFIYIPLLIVRTVLLMVNDTVNILIKAFDSNPDGLFDTLKDTTGFVLNLLGKYSPI